MLKTTPPLKPQNRKIDDLGEKIMGKPPNHPLKNRVWNPYFHPPFWGKWGKHPYFCFNTHVFNVVFWASPRLRLGNESLMRSSNGTTKRDKISPRENIYIYSHIEIYILNLCFACSFFFFLCVVAFSSIRVS